MDLVLGVDAGGTSTRAVVVTTAGDVVGRGRAGGGNPAALGAERAFGNLGLAVREALTSADPAEVRAVTVGLAGAGTLRDPAVRAAFERTVRGCGPAVPPRAVGDAVVAFAAGTAAPSGTVLISGTGAVAVRITGREPVAVADGHGWLLGDEGSAFWLGRAAARAAVRQAGPGRPWRDLGPLARFVVRHLLPEIAGEIGGAEEVEAAEGAGVTGGAGGCERTAGAGAVGSGKPVDEPVDGLADLLATAAQARHPLALAELAPLVVRAARLGDPSAEEIVAGAAARLAGTAARVHDPAPDAPIVLAGGVLTSGGPVRRAVVDLLRRRWGDPPIVVAGDGAGAAAWLAAVPFLGREEAAGLHRCFVGPGAVRPGAPGPAGGSDPGG
ncbi:N-acetylglucosamine kinase [Planomonospora parontospora]|uniref:N-acetylglucosamine kinase n=1 Tax=Planomonospora parontospora TaxID=58119 RepID=UPI00166FC81C|nr:BadF/BadG/BcrA/BcrD ATPase family protein [Planomonospora parontospora]GGL14621.1 N-acetylglucosamine kinase [Planomonospora parontospora subsp. antibiotica]GII15850.1 N-acetylglucosamine kinase [Planomonospora parontospora subsp. antibiotica]